MDALMGKWDCVSSENQEALFDAYDLAGPMRDGLRNAKGSIEYCRAGDDWTVIIEVPAIPLRREVKFKLGEEFADQDLTGQTVNVTVTWDGGKLVEQRKNPAHPEVNAMVTKEIQGSQLVATTTVKGVSMVLKFNKC